MQDELIEILSVDLLEKNRSILDDLNRLAHTIKLEFGWHYLLDLSWILQQLGSVNGKRIMDAGAGVGIIQWYLAQQGAEVISVDRNSRAGLPLNFRVHIRVEGLRSEDLISPKPQITNILSYSPKKFITRLFSLGRDTVYLLRKPHSPGRVLIYNQDLANLVDIQDNSLDAVVAVSSLEHNTPEWLGTVIKELLRTLKPGGMLLATLNAARDKDWWHAPSSGWCYTEDSLRRLFGLSDEAPSNYNCYDQLFDDLQNCAELRDNLATFYFRSGDNGMPWGKWEPKYQPVGIRMIKILEHASFAGDGD
jgi:SAM-dependent methyltransferase